MTLKEKYPDFPFTGVFSAISICDPDLFDNINYIELISLSRFLMGVESLNQGVANVDYEEFAKKIAIWKLQNA